MKSAFILLLAAALSFSPSAQTPRDLQARIDAYVASKSQTIISLRRSFHRHAELSGREAQTSDVIAALLRGLGMEVRTGVGGYGVVGILTGGRPGPLVAYRADMDAVASTAPDPVPFVSETPGVRHICGHDVHMTIAYELAASLASVRRDLPGRVMFIFQPAEERATGAKAMLDAGLWAKEKPVAIFGLHASPLEAGHITSKPGQMMSSMTFPGGAAPGVTNDDKLYASAVRDLVAVVGQPAFTLLDAPPAGFSEDFGEYQKLVPGVFFFLGLSNTPKGIRAMPHDPNFNVEEDGIAFGIKALAAVVLGRLSRS